MTLLQRYNCLDTIATFRLWEAVSEAATPESLETYSLSKSLSAPLLFAMLKGIRIDLEIMAELYDQFTKECKILEDLLDDITLPLGMDVINLSSPVQVKWLFACLGEDLDSSDREALEQVAKADLDLAPVCNLILAWRDRAKMLTVLKPSLVDADGRMRTFYKVSGTETDRLSSSKNALWTGMNMQNISRDEKANTAKRASIRSIFVADAGKVFLNVDLERADAWGVALDVLQSTGDRSYLTAVKSFDLHVYVCKLVWQELAWTSDETENIHVAKKPFYRNISYRQLGKLGGHLTNYLGQEYTMSRSLKISRVVAKDFQDRYFKAFPGIRPWHLVKSKELQTTGRLTNLFGRKRTFHGRLDSMATLREAIAYLGQSVTAGSINRSLLQAWDLQCSRPDLGIEFLAQVHDSLLFQIPESTLTKALPILLQTLQVPITVTDPRTNQAESHSIPLEASIGWNWSSHSELNPDGLLPLEDMCDPFANRPNGAARTRIPPTQELGFMDRRISSIHRGPIQPDHFPEMGGFDYLGSGP